MAFFGPAMRRMMQNHVPSCSRRGARVLVGARRNTMLRELEESRNESKVEEEEKELGVATELSWESPLQIVRYPDPRLRARNLRIGVFDERLQQLAREMFDVMDEGVGLAAPQVGVNVRLMVFNPEGARGEGEELVLCNPRIVSSSKGMGWHEEGCLSFRQLRDNKLINADVERPVKVKIKAQDVNGNKIHRTFTDPWVARIFQHEYDHLQGTLFPDRVQPEIRAGILPELRALEEAYAKLHPEDVLQRY